MTINSVTDSYQSFFYAMGKGNTAKAVSSLPASTKEVSTTDDVIEISAEARKANAMEAALNRSYALMHKRGLTDEEIESFRDILNSYRSSNMEAKAFLKSLTSEERDSVKRATGYGHRLTDKEIDSFSKEGAVNMLQEQDYRFVVDLNGDDVIENGNGNLLVFPPPSAPETVKEAWDTFSQTLTEGDKLLFMGRFVSLRGFKIENGTVVRTNDMGYPKTTQGWLDLLKKEYHTSKYQSEISTDKSSIEAHKRMMRQIQQFAAVIREMA
jgi:hypothetical protein